MIHYTKKIYKAILGVFLCVLWAFCVASCSTVRYIPTETTEIINYIDSLIIKDSTVIIPIERIVDIVPEYDTLTMETSLAKSVSYVDTASHTLKGKLANKQGTVTKIKYVDRVVYRDTTITKEIPVPVEVPQKYVPKFYKDCTWGFFILLVLVIGVGVLKIYFRRR